MGARQNKQYDEGWIKTLHLLNSHDIMFYYKLTTINMIYNKEDKIEEKIEEVEVKQEKTKLKFADIFFEAFYGIKFWLQRMYYGYSENDISDLNVYLFEKTYAPVKSFIQNYEEHGMALPREFASDPGSWLMILKKIELAFDSWDEDVNSDQNRFKIGMSEEQIKEHDLKVEEGFTLFGKYMRELWDY